MRFAFCIYKYFPHGGVQRNCLSMARACQERGHTVEIFCISWNAPLPEGLPVHQLPARGWRNHALYRHFHDLLAQCLAATPFDAVVGFNKMAGLDLYYAGDPCFLAKSKNKHIDFNRLTGRYRHFAAWERAVFSPGGATRILLLSPAEKERYQHCHGTPDHRFHPLPPGIPRDRLRGEDAPQLRREGRQLFGVGDQKLLLLLIGSGFKTKGLDRALLALAALPAPLRQRTRLVAIGQDDPRWFRARAALLGLAQQVTILPGRDDIPRVLQAGDLLLHPARSENTGNVLLEAMAAGLPLIASAACGYASLVRQAGGGVVLSHPFDQKELNARVAELLADADQRLRLGEAGHAFARAGDFYERAPVAARIIEETAMSMVRAGQKT